MQENEHLDDNRCHSIPLGGVHLRTLCTAVSSQMEKGNEKIRTRPNRIRAYCRDSFKETGMTIFPWLIGALGWGTVFMLWAVRIYAVRKKGSRVPRWMFIITTGWLVFTIMCISLVFNYSMFAPTMRWVLSLSSLAVLAATIINDRGLK